MKTAIGVGLSTDENWDEFSTYVIEAERMGVDSVWSAEAWGHDGATPLAYLAAKTSRIKLGSGILQTVGRTPANLAMTAMTLQSMSGGRFLLGLGVSGPQVVEGWHGVRYTRPIRRLQETIAVVKLLTRGEKSQYVGEIIRLPLPISEGGRRLARRSVHAANPAPAGDHRSREAAHEGGEITVRGRDHPSTASGRRGESDPFAGKTATGHSDLPSDAQPELARADGGGCGWLARDIVHAGARGCLLRAHPSRRAEG